MRRCVRVVSLVFSLLAVAVFVAPASASTNPIQLSLGDSWPADDRASGPAGTYPALLNAALRDSFNCSPSGNKNAANKCKKLELVNVSVGGATTPTLIANQLPQAVSLLEERNGDKNPRNDVEVVTLHIGGNDVVAPIIAACLNAPGSPSCLQTIQEELAAYATDLNVVLSELREAAGPDTRIVIGTYDNPIATCFLGAVPGAVQLADVVLEGGPGVPLGLHDIMRNVAARYDIEVAEVFGDLAPEDWFGGNDCLHPDGSGYQKVADAFVEVLAG